VVVVVLATFSIFFFGGLSIHLSTAILAHMFSYDMSWGSTGKEVERSSFWIEVPRIWQRFKLSFIICFGCIGMIVVFTTDVVPFEMQILGWHWALIIPLGLVIGCHILLPVSSRVVCVVCMSETGFYKDCAESMVDDIFVLMVVID